MEETEMIEDTIESGTETRRIHRLGTVTFGLILIVFGIGFLVHIFNPDVTYHTICQFWPCALLSLGIEVLISTFSKEKAKYDGWSIALCFLVILFSVCMAGLEWFFDYCVKFF